MEASTGPLNLPNPPPNPKLENIKRKLLKHGVQPTPKILHNLRKKELQKSNRRLAKRNSKLPPPLADAQKQAILEESYFQMIKSEYKKFTKSSGNEENEKLLGKPWERLERLRLRELSSENLVYDGEKLNHEHLRELSDVIESDRDKFSWLLDNDVEVEEGWFQNDGRSWTAPKRSETEAVKILIDRLSATELSVKDWKFSRIMRYCGLQFTEGQMLKIVEGLGKRGQWKHALSVVEWVYNSKEHRHFKSRFVYTKLLTVLGRARKPHEALQVFNWMRGDAHIYPDMAAYHSLAVTLGQTGFLKELLNIIESMKEKPKRTKNMRRKNWSPELQPDIVVFNAVLNACVSTCQWKGVSWAFQQLRKNGLRPNGASYGLAMEVMLKSGKYDLVHEFFGKMRRNGEALKALTYKVLVRAFWEEGKVNDAVQAVREMERRGVTGTASVYYELARCLCFHGRWQDTILEIEKLKNLCPTRPLAVTFTGMIMSSMDGGHFHGCVSLYEHSKTLLAPDIGLINVMLKVYGRSDMFLKAKELFEETTRNDLSFEIGEHGSFPKPDEYTFGAMLEASASALQWEYFEYVYKEMILSGHCIVQHKHCVILVEASRAGKWHLLEHAFDSILEAGEIPPVSFFTEMVCQATIRHDHERAANIINAMAMGPSQVSFQDWITLFEKNEDRIDRACLNELQGKLVSHDLVREATVLNLSKALEFICGPLEESMMSKTPEDSSDSMNGNDLNIQEGNLVHTLHERVEEDRDSDKAYGLSNGSRAGHVRAYPTRFLLQFDHDDIEFEHMEHEEGQSEVDEFDFELVVPSSENDDRQDSRTPSAYEILESWKKK